MDEAKADLKKAYDAYHMGENENSSEKPKEQEMSSRTTSKATEMIGHYENLLQSLEEGEYLPASVKKLDPFSPLFAETKETLRDQERSKLLQQLSIYKELADMAKLKEQSEG
jgi:hypothetical protein